MSLEYKGAEISGGKDCLLRYFLKKGRGGTANRTYNFSIVLDLHLVIENQFYEEVCQHQEQELNVPHRTLEVKVGEDFNSDYIYLLICYRIQHFRLSQENLWRSLKW